MKIKLLQCTSLKITYRINIVNDAINWSNEIKNLGIIIDRRLTWNKYVLNNGGKFTGFSKSLTPLLILFQRKINSYLQFFYSICSYLPFAIWCFSNKTNLEYLYKSNKEYLRTIRNDHQYLRNTTICRDLCTT